MTPEEKRKLWGDGPWVSEPDEHSFEYRGFTCVMKRTKTAGHWCGYVAIPPGHAYHMRIYQALLTTLKVHGQLTWSGFAQRLDLEDVNLHSETWMLGFDCGHPSDISPGEHTDRADMRNETEVLMLALGIDLFLPDGPPKYRDFDYAWSQVAKLAHQIVDEPQLEKPPLGPEPWCKECLKPLSECEDKANHKGYMSPTGRSLAKNIEFNQARVLDKMVGFDSETRSIKGWDQGAPDGDHTYVTVLVWNPGLNAHEPQTWRTDDPRYLAMQVAMPLELLNRKKN